MLTVRSRAYVLPTLLFLGIAFALANGLGFNCGNLRQYLLHARHTIDPGFLASDWFTSQTTAHHTAFNGVVAFAGKLARLDVTFAVANAAFAVILVCCVYLLAAKFYRTPILVTALVVLVNVFIPRPHLGWTSIMTSYFQPSTIGAVGLLVGLTCLIHGRYKAAGLALFAAGFFHINYLVWIVAIVGAVVLVNMDWIGLRRSLYLIAPVALAVAYHVPFIVASRSPEQLICTPAAARILHDVYMPFHSRPLTWGAEPFIHFVASLTAGVVAVKLVPPDRRPTRVTVTILAALVGFLAVGILLTAVIQVDVVAMIFPYRLVPFLVLAAQIAAMGAVSTTAQVRRLSVHATLLLWTVLGVLLLAGGVEPYGLLCLGIFVTAVFMARLVRKEPGSLPGGCALLAGIAILLWLCGAGPNGMAFITAFAAAAVTWRLIPRTRLKHARWTGLLLTGRAAAPLLIAVFVMRIGAVRKDLLGPPPPADEKLLYDWCRLQTARDDVFVIPPSLGGFRLGAERAVMIDWKCMPILPRDTIEWYHRLVDECGTEFDTLSQAEAGYAGMDTNRARRLAHRYNARYLVLDTGRHRGDLAGLPCAYANPSFALYDLGDPTSRAQASAAESGKHDD